MIPEFIQRFDAQREELRTAFSQAHPGSYADIVKTVVSAVSDSDGPDPNRIHQIDDGDYQGTLVFVIAAKGYQPSDYWYVRVYYGSCSGCDTLEGIRDYDDNPPKSQQVDEYMMLALHILQGLKPMQGDGL